MVVNIPAEEMRPLLLILLARSTGSAGDRWDRLLGELIHVDMARSPATNWAIGLSGGTEAEIAAIDRAVRVVQEAHPYVLW